MYLKIKVKRGHNLKKIKGIIGRNEAKVVMLESENKENNLKTLYFTQKLMQEGFQVRRMKFYKGNHFKVLLSKNFKERISQ